MLRLVKNYKSSRPKSDGTFNTQFCVVDRVVSQEDGVIIFQRKPIPRSVFRHEGEVSEMYSIENLTKLGVPLQPILQRYGSLTLEQRSEAMDAFETFAPQYDAELQSQSTLVTE